MRHRPVWLQDWLDRHRSRLSFWLHMVGIPLTLAGLLLAIWQLIMAQWDPTHWEHWWRPVGLALAGYLLQFLGHFREGNDMGEIILIKRWLGHPYVAISPRYRKRGKPQNP